MANEYNEQVKGYIKKLPVKNRVKNGKLECYSPQHGHQGEL